MAAALGGWALLSHKEPQALANSPASTEAASTLPQPTATPGYLDYSFAPIPTLEPAATIILPTDAPTAVPGSKPVVIYITPTPSAQQPAVQAPGLRVVDAPPPPPASQPQSQPAQDSQPQASNNSAPPPPPVTNTQSSQG